MGRSCVLGRGCCWSNLGALSFFARFHSPHIHINCWGFDSLTLRVRAGEPLFFSAPVLGSPLTDLQKQQQTNQPKQPTNQTKIPPPPQQKAHNLGLQSFLLDQISKEEAPTCFSPHLASPCARPKNISLRVGGAWELEAGGDTTNCRMCVIAIRPGLPLSRLRTLKSSRPTAQISPS